MTRAGWWGVGLLALAAVALAGARLAATEAVDAPLTPLQKQALSSRMVNHGGDMQALLDAVLRLDRDRVKALAASIDAEPRLARPNGQPDTLNAELPKRYFALQDALRERVRALEVVAGDQEMAHAFGRVAEACVTCHAAYYTPKR